MILVIICLIAAGNVLANPPPPAASDDSNSVLQGPAPGSRGSEGARGLDPWTVVSPAPIAVSRPGGAFLDGLFYVIGGEETGGDWNGNVQIYDPETDLWDAVSADQMPTPASNLCAAALDGLIYVPGGWTGAAAVDQLQIFDPATGTWTIDNSDPMPGNRYGSACAGHEGKLYVFGGWDGAAPTDTSWVYDPQAISGDRWSTLTSSTFAHVYGAAVEAGNGLIFVTGFSDNAAGNFDTVAAYDPVADDWISYPGLQTPRGGAGAWTRGNRLYVGGGGWSTYLTSVESYNLSEGTGGSWEFTAPLNVGRRTFAFATNPDNGQLFAAAGWAGAFINSAETSAGPPGLAISTDPLDFGGQEVGTTSPTGSVTLENTGDADLEVSGVSAASAPFSAAGGTCGAIPFTLTSGSTCTLDYEFSPTAPGPASDTITVDSNAPSSPDSFGLEGNGTEAGISLDTDSLLLEAEFGDTDTGTVTVSNNGDADLQISDIAELDDPFAFSGGDCFPVPTTLAPSQSCTIEVTFQPTSAVGTVNDSFDIVSNAPSGPHTVSVQGISRSSAIAVPMLDRFVLPLLALMLATIGGWVMVQNRG